MENLPLCLLFSIFKGVSLSTRLKQLIPGQGATPSKNLPIILNPSYFLNPPSPLPTTYHIPQAL